MAKTDLTREIERAILEWYPAQIGDIKINKFRGEHTALEVPAECGTTAGGIVDAVRVSEYFGDLKRRHICRVSRWKKDGLRAHITCPKGKDLRQPNLERECDNRGCSYGTFEEVGLCKILLTCFEIKVTKSDFKSQHGHNFIGNMNYYAVPEEIYKEIEPLVPEGIGILVYLHKGKYCGLRTKRKATFREMTEENQKWLLLSVFKRIRDMDYKYYQDRLKATIKPQPPLLRKEDTK